jgi:hypothetical protein
MVFDLADGNNQKGKILRVWKKVHRSCVNWEEGNLYFGSTWASTVIGTNK